MFGVSPTEMLVLMLVALLVYGGDLPRVARSWGKTLSEFKRGLSNIQNEFNSVMNEEPPRIPYHDPVYSHNAGTIDGHLANDESIETQISEAESNAPEVLATQEAEAAEELPSSNGSQH